jgi:malate dehydrogenase
MGIPSNGYGIPEGRHVRLPGDHGKRQVQIVQGLEIDAFSQEKINITLKELEEERAGVQHLLG